MQRQGMVLRQKISDGRQADPKRHLCCQVEAPTRHGGEGQWQTAKRFRCTSSDKFVKSQEKASPCCQGAGKTKTACGKMPS